MAISASGVYEVQAGGNDANGGGFVTGASGTDYSLLGGKRTGADITNISTTDAVAVGTTTITSVTGNFTSALIGNIVYFQGGTGSIAATRRQVISVASATSITVDAVIAASTGMTMNIGGALISPSIAASAANIAGQLVYIKAGTYSIVSAVTATAGGCLSTTAGTFYVGYSTNRTTTNTDTRPLLQLSSVSSATIHNSTSNALFSNIEFDGASQTTSRYAANVNGQFLNCLFRNFTAANAATCTRCYGTGCSAAVFGGVSYACEASANTATPFTGNSFKCVSYSNTGASTNGFTQASAIVAINCFSYANGNHGFNAGTTGAMMCINCYAEGNTGRGFNGSASNLINCSAYNNTAGASTSINLNLGFITPTGSAFTNAAGNDFTLNNTSGAGALLRAAGYPATFNASGSVDKSDIGALQHLETATGGMLISTGMYGGFE